MALLKCRNFFLGQESLSLCKMTPDASPGLRSRTWTSSTCSAAGTTCSASGRSTPPSTRRPSGVRSGLEFASCGLTRVAAAAVRGSMLCVQTGRAGVKHNARWEDSNSFVTPDAVRVQEQCLLHCWLRPLNKGRTVTTSVLCFWVVWIHVWGPQWTLLSAGCVTLCTAGTSRSCRPDASPRSTSRRCTGRATAASASPRPRDPRRTTVGGATCRPAGAPGEYPRGGGGLCPLTREQHNLLIFRCWCKDVSFPLRKCSKL